MSLIWPLYKIADAAGTYNSGYYPGISELCAPFKLPCRSGVPGKVPRTGGANPVLEMIFGERLMGGCTRFIGSAGGRFLKLTKSEGGSKICVYGQQAA